MKTLKFRSHLADQIIRGEKTTTWRLFDDKELTEGDSISFVRWESGEEFGAGEIKALKVTTLGSLEEADWEGHERFASESEMYETYKQYYGPNVGPNTEVKILSFSFKSI